MIMRAPFDVLAGDERRAAENAAQRVFNAWEPSDGLLQLAYNINTAAAQAVTALRADKDTS